MKKLALAVLVGAASLGSTAQAECTYESDETVTILSNSFQAWQVVTRAMGDCAPVEAELDSEYRTMQATAFDTDPSLYHLGGVANGTIRPLLDNRLIRPLDDLVEKYSDQINPNQLIRIDGEVMALGMMINAQHLMYRRDILDDLGLDVPETYDELLAAAEAIREADIVRYPLGGTYASGWDLGQEFVNMYLGFDGEFFDGSQPSVHNEAGVQALEMMAALTEYMDPEYLVSDSTYVQQQFQRGEIAMATLWATRASAMNDESESDVVGLVGMAAAPAAYEGGRPATTLWWDGIVVARNISDAAAENAFRVALEGLSPRMVRENNDVAVWLVDGYEPGELAEGAAASADGGAPGYPTRTEFGLMHTALGNNVADYMTGRRSAEDVLEAIEDDYLSAAREQGLL